MRFRDDDDAGDSPRSEFVEHRLHDRRAGDARSIDERLLDPFDVVEVPRLAFIQIEYDLRAKYGAPRRLVFRRGKRRMSRHVSCFRTDPEPTRTIA